MPRTHNKIKADIKEGVKNGKYYIGELIEPKTFKKFAIDNDKIIKETTYQVHGRKIPLNMIRENIYKKHTALGVMREQDTYNRKLLTWTDHSVILGTNFN